MKSKNHSNPDLNQIRTFVEVVHAGSFAGASARLGSPPNTVSRHIQQLETALAARLMHRSTRKLTLTTAGRTFFDRCAASVAELQRATQQSLADHQTAVGMVRVAAPADFFELFTLETMALFMRRYPQVRMEFVLEDGKTDLIGQSIDVAIRAAHLVDERLPCRKLLATEFRLVAGRAYLQRHGVPAELHSLALHDCLLLGEQPGPALWRLRDAQRVHEIRVQGRFKANTARAVVHAAVAGLGIALLPEPMVAPHIAAGILERVLPEYYREGADLYAVWPSRQVPHAVRAFIDFVADSIGG